MGFVNCLFARSLGCGSIFIFYSIRLSLRTKGLSIRLDLLRELFNYLLSAYGALNFNWCLLMFLFLWSSLSGLESCCKLSAWEGLFCLPSLCESVSLTLAFSSRLKSFLPGDDALGWAKAESLSTILG